MIEITYPGGGRYPCWRCDAPARAAGCVDALEDLHTSAVVRTVVQSVGERALPRIAYVAVARGQRVIGAYLSYGEAVTALEGAR